MPGFNGTGPSGNGPKTGRTMGYCQGGGARSFAGRGRGLGLNANRGFGFRRGGRASGWGLYPNQSGREDLQSYKQYLESELQMLEKEINKDR